MRFIVLAVCACLAARPGWSATLNTFEITDADGLCAAVAEINAYSGEEIAEYVISLKADLVATSGLGVGSVTFSNGRTKTTLLGNGHRVRLGNGQGSGNDKSFQVSGGATLNLGTPGDASASALRVSRETANDTPGLVHLQTDSFLNMYDGVVLEDAQDNNYHGGGVTVVGGLFTMKGGTIQNCGIVGGSVCFGGGVSVTCGGKFVMDGGLIKDCYVEGAAATDGTWQTPWTAGGGVFVFCDSSFVMNGGCVEGCEARMPNGGVVKTDGVGGGVAVCTSINSVWAYKSYGYLDAAFVMNGGTIQNCSAHSVGGGVVGGLAYTGYQTLLTGDYPSGHQNGLSGQVMLLGGSIKGCSAQMNGGGVALSWIRGSETVKIADVTIQDCSSTAGAGGGVAVLGNFTSLHLENAVLSGCSAATGGGALWLQSNKDSAGTLLDGVSVQNCSTADGTGGGIAYDATSKLSIKGPMTVTGCTAKGRPNNLHCLGSASPVYVAGDLTGSTVYVTDPLLWEGGSASDTFLTSGDKTYNAARPYLQSFQSDHVDWYADWSDVNTDDVRLYKSEASIRVTGADAAARYDISEDTRLYAYLQTLGLTEADVSALTDAEDPEARRTAVALSNSKLDERDADGVAYWEKFVLGVDKDAHLRVTTDCHLGTSVPAGKAVIRLNGVSVIEGTGFDVHYTLNSTEAGVETVGTEKKSEPNFLVDLAALTAEHPVGKYQILVHFVRTDDATGAVVDTVVSCNAVGILFNDPKTPTTLVAVPWRSLQPTTHEAQPIEIDNLLRKETLDAGDTLSVYDGAANLYRSWTLAEDAAGAKSWQPVLTVSETQQSVAGSAAAATLARGEAAWLVRAGYATKPLYMEGEWTTDTVDIPVAANATSLVANPNTTGVDLNADLTGGILASGASKVNDVLLVPDEKGGYRRYTYRESDGWGYLVQEIVGGRVKSVRKTRADADFLGTIAPGNGFWYISRGGAFTLTK